MYDIYGEKNRMHTKKIVYPLGLTVSIILCVKIGENYQEFNSIQCSYL